MNTTPKSGNKLVTAMNIDAICDCILDEGSTPDALRKALKGFASLCADIGGVRPDPSFDAWADDALLANGVAINPQAAAHCVLDYQRSVTYLRGVYAAIGKLQQRFCDAPLEILYAGCGPYATLLLPLLVKFSAGELNIHLLDVHQRSLDSVERLLAQLDFSDHSVHRIQADACDYQHPRELHLVIAETMQKSLEQEPQFAVTANLAPQLLPGGVFIPQKIDITFGLADLQYARKMAQQAGRHDMKNLQRRYPVATVLSLSPETAAHQLQNASYRPVTETWELGSTTLVIPHMEGITQLDPALFTHIVVFEGYCLDDYESEITLPMKCHDLAPLTGGEHVKVSYQPGNYPRFNYELLQHAP